MDSPCLVAIDGPLKGRTFVLTGDQITLGREPGNRIAIPDLSVSRQHCRVARLSGGRFRITDQDSRNGTFVRGLPVRERILEHGDEIRLGESLFLFLTTEDKPVAAESRVVCRDSAFDDRTIIKLRREDSVYLKPEELLKAPAPFASTARALAVLLRTGTAIHLAQTAESLAQRLLGLIAEVVPAERGAILLLDRGRIDPASAFCWQRGSQEETAIGIASGLVERVLAEGVAVLSNDAETGAVLAAPLFDPDKPLGVVYLHAGDPRIGFEEEHLQLIAAIGVFAGAALEKARRLEWLGSENRRLREEMGIEHGMVGESPAMQEVYRFIAKLGPADSTVLLHGESGTGKELAARAIHAGGPRAARPFVAINCAAMTETLVESELFGHEKGAFTGAIALKRGKLEVGDGGTVFLDEVGELPLSSQSKLLRVLQEREFERVGGTHPIKVDIRLIAATNRDLRAAAAEGTFRLDLFYRLDVVALRMPPLRERRDDIPLLASYFASRYSQSSGRPLVGISPEARACLAGYDWPGNVRELANAIEHAVVLGSTDLILPEDLPAAVLEGSTAFAPAGTYQDAVQRQKKETILRAIEKAGGNITEAARLLEVHPNYLHRLIRNLNLRPLIKTAGS